jgi:hypothetical protein
MKLFYRGLSYDYDSVTGAPLRTPANPLQPFTLSYRGLNYAVDPAQAKSKVPDKVAATLIYRGARYNLNGGKVTTTWVKPVVDFKLFTTKASAKAEASNLHRVNIHRNLERRLKVAEASGDQALVQLLHQEMEQMA